MRSPHKPRPLLPVTGVHAGAPTRAVRTNQAVHTGNSCVKSREFHAKFVPISCEFRTNSHEFSPVNRLQACRVLAPLVLGTVRAWWMLLGGTFIG